MPPYGAITALECRFDADGLQIPVTKRGMGCVSAPNPGLTTIARDDVRYGQFHSVEFFFLDPATAAFLHQGLVRLHIYILSAALGGQPIPIPEAWRYSLPPGVCEELGLPEPELVSPSILRQNPLGLPSDYPQIIRLVDAIQTHMRTLEAWICLAEEKAAILKSCGTPTSWQFPTGDHVNFYCVGATPRPPSPIPNGSHRFTPILERVKTVWYNRGDRHVSSIPITNRQANGPDPQALGTDTYSTDGNETDSELDELDDESDSCSSAADSPGSPVFLSLAMQEYVQTLRSNNEDYLNSLDEDISSSSD